MCNVYIVVFFPHRNVTMLTVLSTKRNVKVSHFFMRFLNGKANVLLVFIENIALSLV